AKLPAAPESGRKTNRLITFELVRNPAGRLVATCVSPAESKVQVLRQRCHVSNPALRVRVAALGLRPFCTPIPVELLGAKVLHLPQIDWKGHVPGQDYCGIQSCESVQVFRICPERTRLRFCLPSQFEFEGCRV